MESLTSSEHVDCSFSDDFYATFDKKNIFRLYYVKH